MNRLPFLLFSVILVSCKNPSPVQEKLQPAQTTATITPKDTFEKSVIIPSVPLKNNASETYALYLPKSFSDSAKLNCIIFFDPHGDGALPVNLYKKPAEEFSCILIGSNSSKNGMSLQQSKSIADKLINEAVNTFHVSGKGIALCGFSGGAKAALYTAAENPLVSSVIYCGASLPVNPKHPLRLLGFAGNRDMNYTEVVSFGWDLMSAAAPYLIEWNGKHEFPDEKTFRDAFVFLNTGKIDDYEKKKPTITPAQLVKEENQKQLLLKAFGSEDLSWWKHQISLLNQQKAKDVSAERLLGFISLACYSLSNNALQQNNLPAAEKILAIYQLADPGNKDCQTFLQQLQNKKSGIR